MEQSRIDGPILQKEKRKIRLPRNALETWGWNKIDKVHKERPLTV